MSAIQTVTDALSPLLLANLEHVLRLGLAALLGAAIGLERELRLKEAGVRTHLIVCISACLMMLVSKYGFNDLLGLNGVGVDPSRVAASIVSGVGFLGAGVIFIRGAEVNGLTTSAGVWATAGVGMATGAGMYPICIAATLLILLLQYLLHRPLTLLRRQSIHMLRVQVEDTPDCVRKLSAVLKSNQITILRMRAARGEKEGLRVDLEVRLALDRSCAETFATLLDEPYVRTVEW